MRYLPRDDSRTSAAKQLLQHALDPRTRNTDRARLFMCKGCSLSPLAPTPSTESTARTNSSCAIKPGPPARGKAFVPPKWPSGRKHPSSQQSSRMLQPGPFLAGSTSKLIQQPGWGCSHRSKGRRIPAQEGHCWHRAATQVHTLLGTRKS